MLTWYKNEEHRSKRLEQMRTYYYKKKTSFIHDYILTRKENYRIQIIFKSIVIIKI